MTQNYKINTHKVECGCFLHNGKSTVNPLQNKWRPQQAHLLIGHLPLMKKNRTPLFHFKCKKKKMWGRDFLTIMTRHLSSGVFLGEHTDSFHNHKHEASLPVFWEARSVQELHFKLNRRAMRFMRSPATRPKLWRFGIRLLWFFCSAQKCYHYSGCSSTVNYNHLIIFYEFNKTYTLTKSNSFKMTKIKKIN